MTRFFTFAALILTTSVLFAQSYVPYNVCNPTTDTGQSLRGAQVYFLTQPANTTTLTPRASVYSSATGGSVSQPVLTNGQSQCNVYLAPGTYTVAYAMPDGTQYVRENQIVGGSGGSGLPATYVFLSAASDIGAQINNAVTQLGQAGGVIVLPVTSSGTWSTTATIPWRSISLIGSGPLASVFNCTVAGDCLVIHPDIYSSTNGLPAGGTVASFSIVGNGAANQVDIHGEDLEGWTLHDIVLDGASAPGDVCLKLEDLNYWTERNHTYNFQFGYGCNTSVELYTNPSDPNSYGSFGYNDFAFSMQPGTNQIGLNMVGTMELYNGSLTIVANAQGTSPTVLEASGAATATGERLNMDVEGMPGISGGNIFKITSNNANLQFIGSVNDHPANPIGSNAIAAGSQVVVAAAQSMSGTTVPVISTNAASGFTYAFAGFQGCPNQPAGAPCISEVGQSTANNAAAMFYFQSAGTGIPNPIGGLGINGNNASISFNGLGDLWAERSLGFPNPSSLNAGPDTALSRINPAVMALGNGTAGNTSGWLQLSAIGNAAAGNTDLRGHLTLASGTASYTFGETYTVAPTCTASDTTAAAAVKVTTTTTTLTLTGTGSDVLNYVCAD